MEDNRKKIIIKRVKKIHGGSHGGSWKVAYADFVTALMAFFLLMWLLNMTSQEKRAVLAMYFKHFSLFDKGGKSFMHEGGIRPTGHNLGGEEIVDTGEHQSGITNDELATKLMTGIDQNVQLGKEQVFIAITEEGIRIQIVDSQQNPIFPAGSAELTDTAKQIVRSVASILKNFPNEIAVEGHTDSSPTRSEQVSNWELSVARASSARRELEQWRHRTQPDLQSCWFCRQSASFHHLAGRPQESQDQHSFCQKQKTQTSRPASMAYEAFG